MKEVKFFLRFLLLISLCGIGCQSQLSIESEDPNFKKAQGLVKQGYYAESLVIFDAIIHSRVEAPESHLESGIIYLNQIHDSINAIYHFQKYLQYKPNSQAAPFVRQLIQTAKKEFALQLPGEPVAIQTKLIEDLRLENIELKAKLTKLQPPAPVIAFDSGQATSGDSHSMRKYIIAQGDTLGKISQKVYGTPNRWQSILQANTSKISNPKNLKIGQEINIPE